MMRNRRGFSFIELMTVLAVIGILAALALPRIRDTKARAIAAAAIGDFGVVRVASFNYFADKNGYPADQPEGVIPPELVSYLPAQFTFTKANYTLDFESFSGSGLGTGPTVLAVTVRSADPRIVNNIARSITPGSVGLVVGSAYTYIITGL
jgi:prepilin-type N-terminal cleavage/methylation domain-containing protein